MEDNSERVIYCEGKRHAYIRHICPKKINEKPIKAQHMRRCPLCFKVFSKGLITQRDLLNT